jgi:hypothetical protein
VILCPYCKIRPKKKATCEEPECQHKHRIGYRRKYFDKFERKTPRRVSVSIVRVRQQSVELAAR